MNISHIPVSTIMVDTQISSDDGIFNKTDAFLMNIRIETCSGGSFVPVEIPIDFT
jgi:hypothetical protein